jgi:hypothetical protein
MFCSPAVAAVLFLAAMQQKPFFACGDLVFTGAEADVDRHPNWKFISISPAEFEKTFANAKRVAFGKVAFGLASDEKRDEFEESTTAERVGVTITGRYYRLVDESGHSPELEQAPHAKNDPPTVSRVTEGGGCCLFRLQLEGSSTGAHSQTDEHFAVLIAVKDAPKIVAVLQCSETSMGGACTSQDVVYGQPRRALSCDWAAQVSDYVCRDIQQWRDTWTTHRAERRFALLSGKALPVPMADVPFFASLSDLAAAARRHGEPAKQQQRVFVDGIGLLQPILAQVGHTVLYAAPGFDDHMRLRVYALPPRGEPFEVVAQTIVDGYETESPSQENRDEPAYAFVDAGWTISVLEGFALKTARVSSVVLHDGESRGVFWVAVDEGISLPRVGVLRVASDAGEYMRCVIFVRPAGASSVTLSDEEAQLTIEPHSWWNASGEAVAPPDGEVLPCHVHATISWSRELGFTQVGKDVACLQHELFSAVTIGPHGELSSTPLRYVLEEP